MSSKYVRDHFRTWVQNFVTPFFETVNTEQAPQVPMWCTLEFINAGSQRLDLCGARQERGSVDVWFFGPGGSGDDALLAQAEADIATLMQNTDDRLTLLTAQPPSGLGGLDELAFFYAVDYLFLP